MNSDRRDPSNEVWSIDLDVWEDVVGLIEEARQGNPQTYDGCARIMLSQVKLAGIQEAQLYVWYMLRHVLAGVVGRVPSEEELHETSIRYNNVFGKVVKAPPGLLEDLFRKVFELTPMRIEVGPGELFFLGPAAMAVMWEDSGLDFSAMKEKLNKWWIKSSPSFYNEGLLSRNAE